MMPELTPTAWAVIFGGTLLLASAVITAVCCVLFVVEMRADRQRLPGALASPDAPDLAAFKPAKSRPHVAAMRARNEAEGTDWGAP